jgi:hypothetical protein
MLKGKKVYSNGNEKKCDNGGDSIYGLVGKWKAIAKKNMHKIFRTRLKQSISKEEANE